MAEPGPPIGYDLICVGGGIAGASLGRALALHGARVLIIEREMHFRDRVRGEAIHPWGVVEARALGIADLLLETCGQELRWWRSSSVATPAIQERDLVATTPHRTGELTFYHPQMQETLLQSAAGAGVEVRRGSTVIGLVPGAPPAVIVQTGSAAPETIHARLIVGADGRKSRARAWGGFAVNRDDEQFAIAGVLLAGVGLPGDGVRVVSHAGIGQFALFFPLHDGHQRAYCCYRRPGPPRPLSGRWQLAGFLAACVAAGADPAWFADTEAAGPLAAFEGADSWVDRPYRAGVALVGDAAATSDPS
jgi:2-polyprenyl-6-methoxyphenol hydroxylase-like FAD-dependent oxidoreductase